MSKCQKKKLKNKSACISGYSILAHKILPKNNIFVAYVKNVSKCLVNSHIGTSKKITEATKNCHFFLKFCVQT
jgi:hypothetical protein